MTQKSISPKIKRQKDLQKSYNNKIDDNGFYISFYITRLIIHQLHWDKVEWIIFKYNIVVKRYKKIE